MQPSENKLFSENAFQNAVFAAYQVGGLFLCGQIAYGKWFGFVHSYENKLFSEKVFQNAVLAAYQVGGLFLDRQIAYGKQFGIVRSSENNEFSEMASKNCFPNGYLLRTSSRVP